MKAAVAGNDGAGDEAVDGQHVDDLRDIVGLADPARRQSGGLGFEQALCELGRLRAR